MTTFKARGFGWIDAGLVVTMLVLLLIGWACLTSLGCNVYETQIEACGRACHGALKKITYDSCECASTASDGGTK